MLSTCKRVSIFAGFIPPFHSIPFHSILLFAAKRGSRLQDEVTRSSAFSVGTKCISLEVTTFSTFNCFLVRSQKTEANALEGRETLASSATVENRHAAFRTYPQRFPKRNGAGWIMTKQKDLLNCSNWPIGDSRNVAQSSRKI